MYPLSHVLISWSLYLHILRKIPIYLFPLFVFLPSALTSIALCAFALFSVVLLCFEYFTYVVFNVLSIVTGHVVQQFASCCSLSCIPYFVFLWFANWWPTAIIILTSATAASWISTLQEQAPCSIMRWSIFHANLKFL